MKKITKNKRKRKKTKWIINKKKMIRSISILVLMIILIFSIIKSIKNKKSNNNKEVLAHTDITEEAQKEDNMLVALSDNTQESETTKTEDTSWDEDAQETKVILPM